VPPLALERASDLVVVRFFTVPELAACSESKRSNDDSFIDGGRCVLDGPDGSGRLPGVVPTWCGTDVPAGALN
jgi:hypothetical protein